MSHASIVRSTTVVYSHRFLVFGVFIPWDWYWCWDTVTVARSVSESETDHAWNKHTKNKKSMAVHYSCAPDDGSMCHPKHVELINFSRKQKREEKRILYIQLD
jgi:hypothetical protein